VAVRGSDLVVLTSDNPRTEDPAGIISEIESGMVSEGVRIVKNEVERRARTEKTPYLIIQDRREAVAAAICMAKTDDVVVLAGKGHENYQIIGEKKIHFDDREVAREEIRKRHTAGVG